MNGLLASLMRWSGGRLDGYKTRIAGIGLALVGFAGLIGQMYPDAGLPKMAFSECIDSILIGLGIVGVGHKLEKQTSEVARQTEIIKETGTIGADAGGP